MLVGGLLAARSGDSDPKLQPGMLAVMSDGGKSGLKKQFISPWRCGSPTGKEKPEEEDDFVDGISEEAETPAVVTRCIMLTKDEDTLRARRTLLRGTAVIPQTEGLHLVSAGPLNLPERGCAHYGGSNRGTVIGPVLTPAISDEWKLTVKDMI